MAQARRILENLLDAARRLSGARGRSGIREVVEKYSGMPPSEEILKAFLVMDKSLKDEAVPEFMRTFAATMSLAKISENPIFQELGEPGFENGEESVSEASVQDLGSRPKPVAETAQNISSRAALPLIKRIDLLEAEATQLGVRREVITLDEGDVVITFPEGLSPQSFADLKDHLDLFVKKMQRRASAMAAG